MIGQESVGRAGTMFKVLELKADMSGTAAHISGPAAQVGHEYSTRDQALAAIKTHLKRFKISGRNSEGDYWWARDSEGLRKCWIADAD